MNEQLDTRTGWLSTDELQNIRANVPLVYVDAVPVRVDDLGRVTHVGMLLRQAADGSISRMVVSGRVLYGERIRDALLRHLEKDLGPVALPCIPPDVAPFTVVEYFPDPDVSGFHDPRHHAVSLAFVVPVSGDCQPTQEALDLAWYSPAAGGQRGRAPRDDRRPRPPHPPRAGPRRSAAVTGHQVAAEPQQLVAQLLRFDHLRHGAEAAEADWPARARGGRAPRPPPIRRRSRC